MSVTRLRHVAQVNPPTPEFDLLADDEPVTFLPLEAVWPGSDLDVSRTRPKGEVSSGYTRFREGDVLVPKITPTFEADRSTIAIGLRQGVGAGTTELHILRPGPDLDVRYANYLISSRPFLQGGKVAMKGVAGQQRVPDEWLRDLRVPVSNRTWQRAIADFLDAETARIDALIAKKRRLDELIQDRLSAVIGVTTAEGKPTQVRRVTSLRTSGPRGWAERVGSSGAPFIRSGNLHADSVNIKWAGMAFVEEPESHEAERSRVRVGDVLVGITGANTGWVEIAEQMHDGGYVSQHVGLLRPRIVHPKWLAYSVFSPASRDQLLGEQYGGTKQQLSLDELAELVVHIPPLDRQEELLSRLDYQVETANRLRAKLRHQLELLAEHRQALITAAVTGRIEVPGAAASHGSGW